MEAGRRMKESFSEHARRILDLARDEAARLHHEYIGTEHILLGMAGAAGPAADAPGSFGITLDGARAAVERIVGVGPESGSPDDLGMTPRAKEAIGFAREEAGRHAIGPEHLLLGLAREVEGVPARVMHDLGADQERVHAEVSSRLGRGA